MAINEKKTATKTTAKASEKTKDNVVLDVVEIENIKDDRDDIIDALMKKVEELTNIVKGGATNGSAPEDIVGVDFETNNLPEEPLANKQVRIISLCFGELNISTEPFGKGRLVAFSKFGEVKTVLYSTLIDLVNTNRKFAENGSFYILDKNAVYHLGLSDYYKGLMSKEIMDNIDKYDIVEIRDILSSATEEQRETVVRNTLDKMYKGKDIDLNKCDTIGRACGIDIMAKLKDMRETDEFMSK